DAYLSLSRSQLGLGTSYGLIILSRRIYCSVKLLFRCICRRLRGVACRPVLFVSNHCDVAAFYQFAISLLIRLSLTELCEGLLVIGGRLSHLGDIRSFKLSIRSEPELYLCGSNVGLSLLNCSSSDGKLLLRVGIV